MVPHLGPLPFWLFLQIHPLHPVIPPVILLSFNAAAAFLFRRCPKFFLGLLICEVVWQVFFCFCVFFVSFFGEEKNKEGSLGGLKYSTLILCTPTLNMASFIFFPVAVEALWWEALITNASFFCHSYKLLMISQTMDICFSIASHCCYATFFKASD